MAAMKESKKYLTENKYQSTSKNGSRAKVIRKADYRGATPAQVAKALLTYRPKPPPSPKGPGRK